MGVGAGLNMYDVVVKSFMFAISSPDELLLIVRPTVTLFSTCISVDQPNVPLRRQPSGGRKLFKVIAWLCKISFMDSLVSSHDSKVIWQTCSSNGNQVASIEQCVADSSYLGCQLQVPFSKMNTWFDCGVISLSSTTFALLSRNKRRSCKTFAVVYGYR